MYSLKYVCKFALLSHGCPCGREVTMEDMGKSAITGSQQIHLRFGDTDGLESLIPVLLLSGLFCFHLFCINHAILTKYHQYNFHLEFPFPSECPIAICGYLSNVGFVFRPRHTIGIIQGNVHLRPISQRIYEVMILNLYNICCCYVKNYHMIMPQFWAWHGSWVVLTCANQWPDWIIKIIIIAKII